LIIYTYLSIMRIKETGERKRMAKQEHIELLQQGKDKWNSWRAEHQDGDIDLIVADLRSTNLSEADLSGANLYRADLSEANLYRANLYRANLSGADLSGANLRVAKLYGADLRSANLSGAKLYGANLRSTNLSGANLSGAKLYGADLSEADLYGVGLSGADLSKARTGKTHFDNIDLRGVKGLEAINHWGPSSISTSTLERSEGDIPDVFLREAGLSDPFIEYVHALVGKPIQYYTCFISYSSKDQDFAQRLYADLQSNGIRCWYAPEDLNIGDKFRQKIDESIRLYDKLLLVLSQHSIASTWVAYEVERALNKEPQGIPNVLYPVRLDDTILTCATSWAQDVQSTRHIGDFVRWKEHDPYQHSFQRLLRALQQKDPRKR
jgi:TIR domain/Pentapeptide repeats (8 copies)